MTGVQTCALPIFPGLFFSLFSVANIWLVGGIARRLGATATESALASALLALSCTYFYYARHLVPYDVALTWGLLAIYVGVKPDAPAQSSLWCGVLAGCAFYTYDGYWAVTAAALVIHAAAGNDARDVMQIEVVTKLLVNRTPWAAISSTFGVLMIGLPMHPSASQRWSSVSRKMRFGQIGRAHV